MTRILLIEDEVIARNMASDVLKNLKLPHDTAETGEEALRLIQKNHYDLILCDLGFPDMTGFEVARSTRQEVGPNQKTVMLALTAHDDKDHQKRAVQSGMTGFLHKPLDKAHCLAVIQSLESSH